MKRYPFPGSFDPLGSSYGSRRDDGGAVDLVQQLLRTREPVADGWDPTSLDRACRTIVASRDGSIRRIHTIIPCPRLGRGALPVVEYAESLADRCGLLVHCSLKDDTITVTFEHTDDAGT